MQYLVLIYEDEKRFANGFPESGIRRVRRFRQEARRRHQGRERAPAHSHCQDGPGTRQARSSPATVLSPKPKTSSAATT